MRNAKSKIIPILTIIMLDVTIPQEDRPDPVCVDGCVYTKQGEHTGDEYCFR